MSTRRSGFRDRQNGDAAQPEQTRRSSPEYCPGNDTAFRNADHQQIRTDALDDPTDFGRRIAQKDAGVDGGRCGPFHGNGELQPPACIAQQLVLILRDPVAVQMRWRAPRRLREVDRCENARELLQDAASNLVMTYRPHYLLS